MTRRGAWRPAWIDAHAPSRNRLGRLISDAYYIRWADLSLVERHEGASSGGWTPLRDIRRIR